MTLTSRFRWLVVGLRLLLALRAFAADPTDISRGRRVSLDADWRFLKGERKAPSSPVSTITPGATSTCRTIGPSKARSTSRSIRRPAPCRSPAPAGTASSSPSPTTCEGPAFRSGVRRRDVQRARLAQRPRDGLAPLRLQRLRRRPHAVSGVRRAGQRAGRATRAGARVVALVSGRRHLPQRLARRHRTRSTSRAGALTSRRPR